MKSRSEFPNPEVHAAQIEIRHRYGTVLNKLIRTIKSATVRDMLNRFRDVLDQPKDDPYGKLPVDNATYGLSPEKNKHACLLNFISWMVKRNWVFNEDGDLQTVILTKADLVVLESIAEKGLDAFEIKGTKFPGYFLREIK